MRKPLQFDIGKGKLTLLLDGTDRLPCELFNPIPAAAKNPASSQEENTIEIPINAFLYQVNGRNILIDAGGKDLAPTLGDVPDLLAELAINPEEIDTIFCTHLHPDHIGGLLQEGAPVFPNAKMRIHRQEVDFWTRPEVRENAPPPFQALIDGACAVVAAYSDQIQTFEDGAEIAPDAIAVHLPGHTPGHSGLRIGPTETGVLIWADIVHAAALQLSAPDTSILFDVDPELAALTRRKLLDQIADTDLRIVGGHLPGLGKIQRAAEGYLFQT